ncbi:D-ribose pyranase [Nonomuraea roseoviolacea subsp. roseoviolacea]|uniref:D-ribose pyranase n=1 Tax=Nonomuraea roseoviolacea subsp. carminata TaxID=160689 RepID=A0ABT1KBY6_9ACTN|nr:D-ribose pyranase [Nonomuraea roseoviolacea]MCP2351460.1 D-ribose pyranase [Nonomuraea roseoviolacea subsp. carminata]
MRRNQGTLNAQLARVISELGHTDTLVVTDAGLPIPPGVERVDLAVRENLPRFLDLLDAVLDEVAVEGVLLSEEIKQHSPDMLAAIEERFERLGLAPAFVPHTAFKQATAGARAAVRSGEFTPYANVLLTAGVVY